MLSSSLIQRCSVKAETLESFFSEEHKYNSFVSHRPPCSLSLADIRREVPLTPKSRVQPAIKNLEACSINFSSS